MTFYASSSLARLDSSPEPHLDYHRSGSSSLTSPPTTPLRQSSPTSFTDAKPQIMNLNVTPSSKCTSRSEHRASFEPLPPIPAVSSFQLSLVFNALAAAAKSSALPITFVPPSSVSSHQAIEDYHDSLHHSYLEHHHPNNPYVPWPKHLRPLIIRSPSPFSQVSAYSRPYSRSGARAPEPSESRATSIHEIRCLPNPFRWRRMKRRTKSFTRRLQFLKNILRQRNVTARTSISPAHFRPTSMVLSMLSRSSVCSSRPRSSVISLRRDSLASWIEARNRASSSQTTHVSMDIDEYERRGSWQGDCRNDVSSEHCSDDSESYNWNYFGVALAAGQEASRRRRR